jgi:hypothetical protein
MQVSVLLPHQLAEAASQVVSQDLGEAQAVDERVGLSACAELKKLGT